MDLHPRLALNAIVTPQWSFAQDLAFWRDCGLRRVGLFASKVVAAGPAAVLGALKAEGLALSTVVCGVFTLEDAAAWPQERAALNAMIELAGELGGGAVYGPPGKGVFDDWDGNVRRYADAVAPCLELGRARGIAVAFEPTTRPYLSFVNNLRDGRDLAQTSGAGLVVDVGNCFTERGHRALIRELGPHIALVQLSDVAVGTARQPGNGLRGLPGTGELPLEDYVAAARDAGYSGAFEIEFFGGADVDRAGIRASLAATSAMLDRVLGR